MEKCDACGKHGVYVKSFDGVCIISDMGRPLLATSELFGFPGGICAGCYNEAMTAAFSRLGEIRNFGRTSSMANGGMVSRAEWVISDADISKTLKYEEDGE